VKPAPFAYRAPDTVAEALGLLAEAPDERSLLAGGQSLVPMMSMRIARPEMVIDLGRIVELAGVERSDGIVRIGAMTRQRTVELNRDVIAALPLLPVALEHVAHIAIRTRGTIGGSISHADPPPTTSPPCDRHRSRCPRRAAPWAASRSAVSARDREPSTSRHSAGRLGR